MGGLPVGKNIRINLTQIPKSENFLKCLRARPGYVLVDSDLTSIEPKVQAVFSRDEMLWELYASGRAHCTYLFNGLHLLEPLYPERAQLLQQMYNPEDPASVEACKAEFSYERSKVLKAAVLSDSYGAGAGSWYRQFKRNGIDVAFETVKAMKKTHEAKYAGLQSWKRRLEREWTLNQGYIKNGLGRVRCVSPDVVKDLANVFSQSTAHDVLLLLIRLIEKRVDKRGIDAYPWIDDFHDETIWEVREEQVDQLVQCFREAYDELNELLQWPVKVTGDIDVGNTLWEFKQ